MGHVLKGSNESRRDVPRGHPTAMGSKSPLIRLQIPGTSGSTHRQLTGEVRLRTSSVLRQ